MAKFDPKKADLDNDGKLSGYEKKRGMAVAKNMAKGGAVKKTKYMAKGGPVRQRYAMASKRKK